jgi:hypothetical protein
MQARLQKIESDHDHLVRALRGNQTLDTAGGN